MYPLLLMPTLIANFLCSSIKLLFQIVLCRVDDSHLDLVYPLSFQESAAICQGVYGFCIQFQCLFSTKQAKTKACL